MISISGYTYCLLIRDIPVFAFGIHLSWMMWIRTKLCSLLGTSVACDVSSLICLVPQAWCEMLEFDVGYIGSFENV